MNSGVATSFFNNKNASLASGLVSLLMEANQECPPWLLEFQSENRRGPNGTRRPPPKNNRFGGGNFGAKDYRQSSAGPPRSVSARPGYGKSIDLTSKNFPNCQKWYYSK